MTEKDALILALHQFREKLLSAVSFDDLCELTSAFAREQFAAAALELRMMATGAADPSTPFQVPVAGTPYCLSLDSPQPLTQEQVALLELIASLLSTAPWLRATAGPDHREFAEWAVASDADVSEHEVEESLLQAVGELLVCEGARIYRLEEGEVRLVARRVYRGQLPSQTSKFESEETAGVALVRDALGLKQSVRIADLRQELRWQSVAAELEIRSWMGIPLMVGTEVMGLLEVMSGLPDAFGQQEERAAACLTAVASSALKSARNYRDVWQELNELNTLQQTSAVMTDSLDQDSVLETVVTEMVRVLSVDNCTLFVWDESSQRLKLSAEKGRIDAPGSQEDPVVNSTTGLSAIRNLEKHPVVQHVFQTQAGYSLQRDLAHSADDIAFLDRIGLQSVLLLPLLRHEQILGLLALGHERQHRPIGHRELSLAYNLASQAAVAIERANLFRQAQHRVEELSAFQEIVLQLNTPLNLNSVFEAITESALKLVNASNLHIYLYNAANNTFTFGSALWRDGRREPAVPGPREDGMTAMVVRQAKPVVINDAGSHEIYRSEEAQAWGIYAIAGFPLKHTDQILGVFTATYLFPHVFSENELLLLSLLADQAAVAVRNAGLFAGSQRRLRDMAALVDMAKQVTGNLKLKDVLQTTVQILQGLLTARASTITMLSQDGTDLVVVAAVGVEPAYHRARMKLEESVSGAVVRKGELIYIRDAHSAPNFLFFDEVVRSLLVVPLTIRNETIGTMAVDSARRNAFSDSDIQLMTIAAAQVSVAIANARFIEELERRAAELAIAYEELKESDRIKDELVQNVSHELRTPLTFVKGYVDLVLEGEMGAVSGPQRDALNIVADKTRDITRLIEDIVTLQRISSGNLQLQEVSLTELVKTAVAGHRLVASKRGLHLTESLPESSATARVDKARVNQVLDNLIGNAMKFSPNGGTISVRMKEVDREIQIVIADQGIGVPKDKQERIFERFYQVDGSARRRFGGTGVGLAIVKRIVDAHHGKIWVESEVGKGSSFFVAFPRLPAEPTGLEY
jgi:signal transduction histidine kinase